MENREIKLSVNNLKISFRTDGGNVQAVRDISFDLYKGETLAIVGESGSGKSVTNRAIMGILAGNAVKEGGEIIYDGQDLMKISEEEYHNIRGDKIAMIFQDPMSSLNPIMRVGKQLTEAMLINGKINRKQSRKNFNDTLARINRYMDAVSQEGDKEKNKRLCADFDKFEYKHLELENAYLKATEAAEDALAEIEDVLFRIEKNSFENARRDIREIVRFAERSISEYVVSERKDELNELLAYLGQRAKATAAEKLSEFVGVLFNRKLKRESEKSDFSEETKALEGVREILTEAIAKDKPNFFAMGYYLTFANQPLPAYTAVKELNVFLRKYLDDNFMLKFIETAKKGVVYAYRQSCEAKRAAIASIDKSSKCFENDAFTYRQAKEIAKAMIVAVKNAINPLQVIKDNLSYTFASSLNEAIEQYFGGVERNRKEEARYAKQAAKYEKIGKRGKNPDYEIPVKNLTDTDALKEGIIKVIGRLRDDFEKQIDREAQFDENGETVALIDYLKEKAAGVAHKMTRGAAKLRALKLLKEVGISEPAKRFKQYPFEFSGGMRQRIVIAIALSADPDILICDEPTTALDVTIQSQILELINRIKAERQLSVIFITHDLGVVANMADRVAVMYAGKIVEIGTAADVFYSPAHPYTWALLASMPDLDTKEKLEAIPGTPPNMIYPPKGDAFAERNKYAMEIDYEEQPPMFKISDTHSAATWLLHPDAPKIELPKVVADRIERMKRRREVSL